MGVILINFANQILLSFGFIIIFGLLIALCDKIFYKVARGRGYSIMIVSGAIGTPIHELSHAFMCLIFGHKIKKIKLYQPKSENGTLGYVEHSYNKKNLYHQIGNFFIGVAPIICGSLVLFLLMLLMLPSVFNGIISEFASIANINIDFLDINTYGVLLQSLWSIFVEIFGFDNFTDILWWIYMLVAMTIVLHMKLSLPDINGSKIGLLLLAAIILIVDVILYFAYARALVLFTSFMVSASMYIIVFLSIAIMIYLVLIILSWIFLGRSK